MVIKIFYVAIAIFCVAMVFLSVQTPYLSDILKSDLSVASMEMSGITDYLIANTTSAKFTAEHGTRYKDRDEFKNFKAEEISADLNHTLVSKTATRAGELIKFNGDAHYINTDGFDYTAQEIIYDTSSKIVRSDVPYVLRQGGDRITGASISYDTKTKQTNSKGIHAWYLIKDQNSTN